MVDTRDAVTRVVPSAEGVQPRGSRLLSWDVLRVVGIVAVLLFHATLLMPDERPGIDGPPWRMDFPFGASLLLTLSGYFAAMTLGKHTAVGWWLRRMARLLPAFFVAVLLIFACTRLFSPADFPQLSYRDLVGNLALMHVLIPSVQYVDWPHWTVPVQVAAFTGIFLFVALRVRGRAASVTMWLLLVAPLVVRIALMGPDDAPSRWLIMAMDGAGVNRVHLFIAGVAIYRWTQGRMGFAQLYLMLVVVLIAHDVHPPPGDSVPAYGLALALICVAAYGPDWTQPVLRIAQRPIRWLGSISYGVYLMHFTIGALIARAMEDHGYGWWLWLPAFFISAILLGWLLTRLVEQPAFRLLTRRLA
ncbi:MAG: acyltransferase family protein [Haloechinothrix sp.]